MNQTEFTAQWEGFSSKVYLDPKGIPTIGFGFNLRRADARIEMIASGLDYNAVLGGRQEVTREQAFNWMQKDLERAAFDAKAIFGVLNQYPEIVRLILVDLVYNMGSERVRGFPGFIDAIRGRKWALAACQLIFTKLGVYGTTGYWKQTKARAEHNASTLGLLALEEYAAEKAQMAELRR